MNNARLMTTVMRRAVCAVLKARMQLLQARLHVLGARLDASKARLARRVVMKLLTKQRALERSVAKWAIAGASTWGRARGSLEARVAALEAAVHAAEAQFRGR